MPRGLSVHVVLDNLSAHTTPQAAEDLLDLLSPLLELTLVVMA